MNAIYFVSSLFGAPHFIPFVCSSIDLKQSNFRFRWMKNGNSVSLIQWPPTPTFHQHHFNKCDLCLSHKIQFHSIIVIVIVIVVVVSIHTIWPLQYIISLTLYSVFVRSSFRVNKLHYQWNITHFFDLHRKHIRTLEWIVS